MSSSDDVFTTLKPVDWNFYHNWVYATMICCTALVAVQLWTRLWKMRRPLQAQHWWMICATVLSVASDAYGQYIQKICVDLERMLHKIFTGDWAGVDIDLVKSTSVDLLRHSWGTPFFYFCVMWSIRFALLCMVFSQRQVLTKFLVRLTWVSTGYMVVSLAVCLLMHMFWCGLPFENNWTLIEPAGYKCNPFREKTFIIFTFVMGLSTDLILFWLLLATVFSLQTTKREKTGVAVISSIGVISVVASIIRVAIILKAAESQVQDGGLQYGMEITMWSELEKITAFATSTLPSLRILFKKDENSKGHGGGGAADDFQKVGDVEGSGNGSEHYDDMEMKFVTSAVLAEIVTPGSKGALPV